MSFEYNSCIRANYTLKINNKTTAWMSKKTLRCYAIDGILTVNIFAGKKHLQWQKSCSMKAAFCFTVL